LISWESKKHPIVSIYSAEEKYIEATTTTCHIIWLKILSKDFEYMKKEHTLIFL